MYNQKQRKLRVFEAFAGIGAQATALSRLSIEYEIVGISEWFTDAIICYDAIHRRDKETVEIHLYTDGSCGTDYTGVPAVHSEALQRVGRGGNLCHSTGVAPWRAGCGVLASVLYITAGSACCR